MVDFCSPTIFVAAGFVNPNIKPKTYPADVQRGNLLGHLAMHFHAHVCFLVAEVS
jgi:hypothetical protein